MASNEQGVNHLSRIAHTLAYTEFSDLLGGGRQPFERQPFDSTHRHTHRERDVLTTSSAGEEGVKPSLSCAGTVITGRVGLGCKESVKLTDKYGEPL